MSKKRPNVKSFPEECLSDKLYLNNIPNASLEETDEILSKIASLTKDELTISSTKHFSIPNN